MPKSVFYFGEPEDSLFGSLITPTRLQRRSAAVLLCNPLGEEASRSHRVFRVLATQLERLGYASMRFDYRCSGDSAGEDADASLDLWIEDIERALGELARGASVGRVVLMGVRLGATLAALAAATGNLRIRQLLLWDPVVDGVRHLRDLAGAHEAFLREEAGTSHRSLRTAEATEYLGLPLRDTLREQLRAINLAAKEPLADRITVIHTRSTEDSIALRSAWGERAAVDWLDVPAGESWNSDSALNAATVPADIVRAIINSIEGQNP
jgi:pimeloyl-ACP methyl ester carboxylesterase